MQNNGALKFGIVAAAFFLASCSSGLPDVPRYVEYQFCKFEVETQDGTKLHCKSLYDVSQTFCDDYNGKVVNSCEESP